MAITELKCFIAQALMGPSPLVSLVVSTMQGTLRDLGNLTSIFCSPHFLNESDFFHTCMTWLVMNESSHEAICHDWKQTIQKWFEQRSWYWIQSNANIMWFGHDWKWRWYHWSWLKANRAFWHILKLISIKLSSNLFEFDGKQKNYFWKWKIIDLIVIVSNEC